MRARSSPSPPAHDGVCSSTTTSKVSGIAIISPVCAGASRLRSSSAPTLSLFRDAGNRGRLGCDCSNTGSPVAVAAFWKHHESAIVASMPTFSDQLFDRYIESLAFTKCFNPQDRPAPAIGSVRATSTSHRYPRASFSTN